MVCGSYNYSIHGVYIPTHKWGGPHYTIFQALHRSDDIIVDSTQVAAVEFNASDKTFVIQQGFWPFGDSIL